MCRAELSDLRDGSGDRRDPGTIRQEGSPGSQAGVVRAGPVLKSDRGEARGPDGRNQGRSRAAKTEGGTPGIGPATEGRHGMSLVPPKRTFREGMSDQHYGRTLRKRRNRSWWEKDYTSLDRSRGTGSASWMIRDPGCSFWLRGLGGSGVVRRTS